MSLAAHYHSLAKAGTISASDAQLAVLARMDALLERPERQSFWQRKPKKQGIYLYGGVGRGKSMLMDMFFAAAPEEHKRRVHFHAFMLEVHSRIFAWRKTHKGDPIPALVKQMAEEAKLLCFDEFQVTDIADAMLLGRLFSGLFAEGVTVIATSNRAPDDLYKDGLQRDRFLPFIALLKEKLEILELETGTDYRLKQLKALSTVYFTPLGKKADQFMAKTFTALTHGAKPHATGLTILGRTLPVPRAHGRTAWFTFAELCETSVGAGDYLALAEHFSTVLLSDIPKLTKANRNEAKRFVTLIDELYEHKTKLICTAAALPDKLYPSGDGSFEFHRTASRLIEMQSEGYLAEGHGAQ